MNAMATSHLTSRFTNSILLQRWKINLVPCRVAVQMGSEDGGRTHARVLRKFLRCSMVSVLLLATNHLQVDGEEYRVARGPVEGFEFAAWKLFKPPISPPSATSTSGNHRFVPTRHRDFNSSSGFIIGLLLLCGDIISQPGATITQRTQNGGSSVPLKGLVFNARSMKSQHKVGTSRVNNLDRIQDLVYSEHADIVLISETWLNGDILDQKLFPLSDFIIYRKDRKHRNGGGVLIAAKASSFKSMREYVPDSENLEDLELVCVEITTSCNKKVLFCSIYWPDPDNDTGC